MSTIFDFWIKSDENYNTFMKPHVLLWTHALVGVYSWDRLCGLWGILRSECGGTRWRTGGEVKGKLANGWGNQYSHTTSAGGVFSITNADAHTSAASSRLNWLPRRFKWTHPFRRKTKCGFCACAIRFRTSCTSLGWRKSWASSVIGCCCKSFSKVGEILQCVLKYSVFFWETYTNLISRDSKRTNALRMVFSAGIFVFVSHEKCVKDWELITA